MHERHQEQNIHSNDPFIYTQQYGTSLTRFLQQKVTFNLIQTVLWSIALTHITEWIIDVIYNRLTLLVHFERKINIV